MKELGTAFYLTGGTALSRGYYNHRFSDDLDFFVNNDSDYLLYVKRFFLERIDNPDEAVLKVDFINDIDKKTFRTDISVISKELLNGKENSLPK